MTGDCLSCVCTRAGVGTAWTQLHLHNVLITTRLSITMDPFYKECTGCLEIMFHKEAVFFFYTIGALICITPVLCQYWWFQNGNFKICGKHYLESILVLCLFGEGISACLNLQVKKNTSRSCRKVAMASGISDGKSSRDFECLLSLSVETIGSTTYVLRSPWFLCGLILGQSTLEVQWIGRGPSVRAKKAGIGDLGSHSTWKHNPAAISNLASD